MTDRRALVIGGGGLAGSAWTIGMLVGLAEKGFDADRADLVVGTSSGAVIGAQLVSGWTPQQIQQDFSAGARFTQTRKISPETYLELGRLLTSSPDLTTALATLGRAALDRHGVVSAAELRAELAPALPRADWPDERLTTTAVDADTGEFVRLTAASGVSMLEAVLASTSLPFVFEPVEIAGRRWLDGYVRSPANADCAAGYDRNVVLAPVNMGFSPYGLATYQADQLRAGGARVALAMETEEIAARSFGNRMDPTILSPIIALAHAQAATVFSELSEVWD